MPANLIPIAIVVAKIGASAVVSLAPVAMSREENDKGQVETVTGNEKRRLGDFLKKEFYAKEFARLENEQLVKNTRNVPSAKSAFREGKVMSERKFASLRNETVVSRKRLQPFESHPTSE